MPTGSPPAAVSLTETKNHLNITSDQYDQDLTQVIRRAESMVARRTGPIITRTETVTLRGGHEQLRVDRLPLRSVESIHAGSTVLDVDTLTVTPHGIITTAAGFPAASYTATIRVGHADTPADVPWDLQLVVLEVARELWKTRRGGEGRIRGEQDRISEQTLWPERAEQAIAPFLLPTF